MAKNLGHFNFEKTHLCPKLKTSGILVTNVCHKGLIKLRLVGFFCQSSVKYDELVKVCEIKIDVLLHLLVSS